MISASPRGRPFTLPAGSTQRAAEDEPVEAGREVKLGGLQKVTSGRGTKLFYLCKIEQIFFRDFRPTSILKRFTSAEEVANLAVFLLSDRLAGYITGETVHVNGGMVMV